jgi:hypothetical protein
VPNQVGISSDLAASEVNRLRKAVEEFSNQASKQTAKMIRLTRVMAWLAAIMTVLVAVQVYLAIVKCLR